MQRLEVIESLNDINATETDIDKDELHFYQYLCEGANKILLINQGYSKRTIELRNKGYNVEVLDYSDDVVPYLKELYFYKGLRDVSISRMNLKYLHLKDKNDLIIVDGKSFNYIYDSLELLDTLNTLSKVLSKNGKLVFNMINPDVQKITKKDGIVTEIEFLDNLKIHKIEYGLYDGVTQI